MRLVLFCEAHADARLAGGLVDRVLGEEGPQWVRDTIADHPEAVRQWVGEDAAVEPPFWDVHLLASHLLRLGERARHGHFNGQPGDADAQSGRNAFQIVRALGKRGEPVQAALFVRDMDDQGDARRRGLAQAKDEAKTWATFKIVLGCVDPKREAWVLAGFEPASDAERTLLAERRQELGFSPVTDSHRLSAKDEGAKTNAKRVMGLLTRDSREREDECWTRTPLARLRERGSQNGLRRFLDDAREALVPLCEDSGQRES